MVFTTHIFIFYFLPLFLLVYFNLPVPLAQPVDHAGQLRVLRLVGAVVRLPDDVHHGHGLHLGQSHHPARGHPRPATLAVAACVVTNLGFLGFFKYYMFAAETLNQLLLTVGADRSGSCESSCPSASRSTPSTR